MLWGYVCVCTMATPCISKCTTLPPEELSKMALLALEPVTLTCPFNLVLGFTFFLETNPLLTRIVIL